ncbi:NAD(P)-dependent dehydrogenase (short-subunit alcohol dehydrogenase family) [Prauserella isguenensis]|uniref:NAD(P)-dependent dehydrogenase (Short-subunit alcohol dehydrogenase family) n=1 Tax=Prauserella isguenensis TaxID=1470180 RepID=A0A839S5C1_9PSEU|nr:SDR family oxidoreductase [Prauserella isguenensis]MBB3052956.1 NAD(P)-dependent dehydrogenase (short-subunit alcohol dehydrogenase family) [Prauserella isguenensis]
MGQERGPRGRFGRRQRDVAGMVVTITGGARGIGAATTTTLVEAGATVAVADLDLSALPPRLRDHPRVHTWRVDVTAAAAYTRFLDAVEDALGPVDVVINNAGIMPLGRIDDEPDEVTAKQLAINLHAVIHGSREAVRRMRPRGRGHIVNVASEAGRIGFEGAATYCATKHGVVGFSDAVRAELHRTGVDISVVMPSVVRTELATGLGESRAIRPVTPEDVAAAVLATIRRPRFDVYVPRDLVVANTLGALLPRKLSDGLLRASGAHRVLGAADHTARKEYESRAVGTAGDAGH